MAQPKRSPKKPYTTPRLRCYGDLRRLTGGSTKSRSETSNTAGPKTKTTGST